MDTFVVIFNWHAVASVSYTATLEEAEALANESRALEVDIYYARDLEGWLSGNSALDSLTYKDQKTSLTSEESEALFALRVMVRKLRPILTIKKTPLVYDELQGECVLVKLGQ